MYQYHKFTIRNFVGIFQSSPWLDKIMTTMYLLLLSLLVIMFFVDKLLWFIGLVLLSVMFLLRLIFIKTNNIVEIYLVFCVLLFPCIGLLVVIKNVIADNYFNFSSVSNWLFTYYQNECWWPKLICFANFIVKLNKLLMKSFCFL